MSGQISSTQNITLMPTCVQPRNIGKYQNAKYYQDILLSDKSQLEMIKGQHPVHVYAMTHFSRQTDRQTHAPEYGITEGAINHKHTPSSVYLIAYSLWNTIKI